MDVDIWAWVGDTQRQLHEAGNTGLAMAIGDVPAQALEGRYPQLDVIAPAIAQQAEGLQLPWLEFYARYWHLIGRIGNRAQGAVAIADAETLAEFAERDDVRDCPSAPGAVVALAIAQANTDGPGYAADRVAALSALDVPPSSPAFAAVAEQQVAALVDAGRVQEAIAHAEAAVEALGGAGREASWELGAASARALLAAGRTEDALSALDSASGFKPDDPVAKEHREGVLRALLLATLGRVQEAVDALPDLDVVGDHPRVWVEWSRAVHKLAGSEQITNSWQLGRVIKQWIDYFAMMGGYRARAELALVAGHLAVARKGVWQARLLADLAESAVGELRSPGDLAERIAELRTAADQTVPLPAPGPDAELVAYFDAADGFNADPERWVGWLAPLSGQDLEATRRHTTTVGFLGYPAKGVDIYWAMLVESGEIETADPQDVTYLTGLLIEARQDERLEQMAERLPAAQRHMALGRLHRARERWEQAAAEGEAAVAAGVGVEANRLWSAAVQQLGDNAKGAAILRDVLDSEEIEHPDIWRMITMATAAEDWETVRLGAAKIGMPLQSAEGPIEEDMGLVRIILPAPDGSQRQVLSLRTGPATARLAIPQPPGMDYNAGDLVVFEPQLLEPIPESAEEQEHFVPPFAAVSMLRPGGYTSWFFDGAAPSEADWTEFNDVLAERGWPMWVYSDENYKVTHPSTGEPLPGVFGWIAVPPEVSPVEVDALLDDATERWVHPLAWLDLAKAVDIEVERHERIVKEYGL
ncbi:tetratricopeptide (TPR) repeat protein [Streptosporangium becharense]|uniref:Tetratricopeptide (TPR) repeat protein n=1 Tax=Streptosporangium becharense TaxID=1816182 RepID=A0A7W9IDL2_9ACTN|nr:tetratricopeptide repeat protein [Streptosporangium becharense]MBB2912205.1 tetratricopeptide (TPR) repeat protein [Streptosporangium becharense]MBB5818752.1 tetratricopeptide (TPR) repeat protein [Streptosporangium becharense]